MPACVPIVQSFVAGQCKVVPDAVPNTVPNAVPNAVPNLQLLMIR